MEKSKSSGIKTYLNTFVRGIAAGLAIFIGSAVYLALCPDNKIVGAFLFSAGLFIVLTQKYALFTGMVPYLPETGGKGIINAIIALIGNAVGASAAGTAIGYTRIGVYEKAIDVVNTKANDSLLSIFILAILCNAIIFYAVDLYKNHEHSIAKYLGTLLLIPVFIICSYEHCVANMCYIAIGRVYTGKALLMLAVAIAGNTVGGIGFYLLNKACRAGNGK